MHRLALRTGLRPALCLLLVTIGGGAMAQTAAGDTAVAQTNEAASVAAAAPAPAAEAAPAQPLPEQPAKQDSATTECAPIGITARGDIVFPLLCKNFVEQHKVANHMPAAEEAKPAIVNTPSVGRAGVAALKPPADVVPEAGRSAAKASGKTSPAKGGAAEPKKLAVGLAANQPAGAPACTHFRSYDAATHSYKGYDGQRYQCR
jgi:hypothetical protein